MIRTVQPAHKKAILFDVNQTLIEQGRSFEQCFKATWSDYTARWLEEQSPTIDQVWEQYSRRWHQRRKGKLSSHRLNELEQECLREALVSLEVPLPQSMLRTMLHEARRLLAEAKRPGAQTVSTLQSLSRKYKLAIISNSPRSEVFGLLTRFELLPYFHEDRIFTPVRASEKKPAPYLFKAALRRLELAPRHAIMVGNSWKHDVCGATKAGIDAVWYHPSKEHDTRAETKKISQQKLGKRNVYCIEQFTQLHELLPQL
jgi:putative hydrolase of the HAD superfamily